MKFTRFSLLLLVYLSATLYSHAQKKFLDGYIILKSNDTIYGKLKEFDLVKSCVYFNFLGSDGQKVKFKKKDVIAYKRGDEEFVKKTHEIVPLQMQMWRSDAFMKVIERGKVTLYKIAYISEKPMGNNWEMKKTVTIYYLERGNEFITFKELGTRKHMMEFFADRPDLVAKIKNKELKYKDMEELVKLYNHNSNN